MDPGYRLFWLAAMAWAFATQTISASVVPAVPDPYRWLEISSSTETQSWLAAQDARASIALQSPERASLTAELNRLYDVDVPDLPDAEGDALFYQRLPHGRQRPQFFSKHRNAETLVLDASLSTGTVSGFSASPDGRTVIYLLHPHNADAAELHIRDLATGREESPILGADWAAATWASNSRGFYYCRLSPGSSLPPAERVADADLRYHLLGTAAATDVSVYPPSHNASTYLSPQASRDGRFLFVSEDHGWTGNTLYARDLASGSTAFHLLFASSSTTAAVEEDAGSYFLLSTERASNGRVLKAHAADAVQWNVIIPERRGSVIQSMQIAGGRLVLNTLRRAESKVEIYSLDGRLEQTLPLPTGSVGGIRGHPETARIFLRFESFFTPPCVYVATVTSSAPPIIWSSATVPAPQSLPIIERAVFSAKDDTKVPIWLLLPAHRKGPLPMILTGYGGFDEPMVPRYNELQSAWLARGGGVAIVEARGGGEFGETWHHAGMLAQKQHTFDDFIAAAEFLVQRGWTTRDQLAIQGASNGGLTVAAVLAQRPDLVRAAICKNPLTDMIRYPLFGEGKAWVPEYGDPSQPEDFQFLYAYSPYHHVRTGLHYPAVLMISADDDDRVDPMHARKFAAALQAANVGGGPILFKRLPHAGHGGEGSRSAQVQEAVDRLSFLLKMLQ